LWVAGRHGVSVETIVSWMAIDDLNIVIAKSRVKVKLNDNIN